MMFENNNYSSLCIHKSLFIFVKNIYSKSDRALKCSKIISKGLNGSYRSGIAVRCHGKLKHFSKLDLEKFSLKSMILPASNLGMSDTV